VGTQWSLVDDQQTTPGQTQIAFNMMIDSSGSVFVVGRADQTIAGTLQSSFVARRSNDGGGTWALEPGFEFDSGTQGAHPFRMARDSAGTLYESGAFYAPPNVRSALRKSVDGGHTWTALDDYLAANTTVTEFRGLYVTPDGGRIVSSGCNWDANSQCVGFVRYSSNGGASWINSNVPALPGPSELWQVDGDSAGNLYVTGLDQGQGPISSWVILKSVDQGVNWTVVNNYQYAAGHLAKSRDLYVAKNGEIFAVGFAKDSNDVYHWVTRRSSDQGTTWVVSDDVLMSNANDDPYEEVFMNYDERDQSFYASALGVLRRLGCN
jgi:hypothetical protein